MSSSYQLYEMIAFPDIESGESVNVVYQLPLLEDIDRPPETVFKMQRRIDDLDADVFRVHYEYVDKRVGRAQGITFTAFVAIVDFPAYYYKAKKLFMIKAQKHWARGAMRQIIRNGQGVNGEYKRITLDSIKHLIASFKGVYFSVDDSVDVSSLALFGPSVDQDVRFTRASDEGAMNYARFDYQFKGEVFHVGISNESNVVLYDNNLDEYLELELVLHIKRNLLDKAQEQTKS